MKIKEKSKEKFTGERHKKEEGGEKRRKDGNVWRLDEDDRKRRWFGGETCH